MYQELYGVTGYFAYRPFLWQLSVCIVSRNSQYSLLHGRMRL